MTPKTSVSEDDEDETEALPDEHFLKVHVKHTNERISELYKECKSGDLDHSPWYQRDNVWDMETKRELLITILYHQGFVPALVLVEPNDGGPRRVLDGKQRLCALIEYIENRFTVRGLHFSEGPKVITDAQRKQLERTPLQCAVHQGISREQELNTFHSLQRGMPLTTGEKLKATEKPILKDATRIYERFPLVMNDSTKAKKRTVHSDLLRLVIALKGGKWMTNWSPMNVWLKTDANAHSCQKVLAAVENAFKRMAALRERFTDYKHLNSREILMLAYCIAGKEIGCVPEGSRFTDSNLMKEVLRVHKKLSTRSSQMRFCKTMDFLHDEYVKAGLIARA